jgi:hypothetical protein
MGLYKEVDYFFKECAKKQVRIYTDACDEGVYVNGVNDPLCIELGDIFANRNGWEYMMLGIRRHRSETRNRDGSLLYTQMVVFLPWEQLGEDDYRCTRWTITYNNDRVRRKQFISFSASQVLASRADISEPLNISQEPTK